MLVHTVFKIFLALLLSGSFLSIFLIINAIIAWRKSHKADIAWYQDQLSKERVTNQQLKQQLKSISQEMTVEDLTVKEYWELNKDGVKQRMNDDTKAKEKLIPKDTDYTIKIDVNGLKPSVNFQIMELLPKASKNDGIYYLPLKSKELAVKYVNYLKQKTVDIPFDRITVVLPSKRVVEREKHKEAQADILVDYNKRRVSRYAKFGASLNVKA